MQIHLQLPIHNSAVSKRLIYFKKSITTAILALTFSCYGGKIDPTMRDSGTTLNEVKSSVYKKIETEKKNNFKDSESYIPNLSRSVISPPPPSIGGEKIISFYVDEKTPLKDVLIELGRVADVDIDIDPSVTGSVIINAKNRPFKEVLDRIATQAKIRYTYKNRVLFFKPNYPYMKSYQVDFLSDSSSWGELTDGIGRIFSSMNSNADRQDVANSNSASSSSDSSVAVNKISGIVTVFATEEQHVAVQKFIEDLVGQSSAQVLIEARIVEVILNDKFKYGIDWANGTNFSFSGGSGAASVIDSVKGTLIPMPRIGILGSDLTAAVGMTQAFGASRSISSPRIHAMNNVPATLSFSDKLIYFKLEKQQATSTGATNPTVTSSLISTKQEENIGIDVSITPSINLKTSEITMLIEPKISQLVSYILDPGSPTDDNGKLIAENKVPQISTRTLKTTVKIKNGNVIVIGGVMKNSSSNNEGGIPFLSKIPLIGWIFKNSSKEDNVTETVIFLKATIINPTSIPSKTDRDIEVKMDPSKRKLFE